MRLIERVRPLPGPIISAAPPVIAALGSRQLSNHDRNQGEPGCTDPSTTRGWVQTKRYGTLGVGVALSVMAVLAQEYALAHYGLSLQFPEWLWIQLAVGWVSLVSGLVVERARPDSRFGTWMWVVGLQWIGRLVLVPPLVQLESIVLGVAFYGLLIASLFTFPSGRFELVGGCLPGPDRCAVGGNDLPGSG